jgi:hypothetical protein
MSTKHLKYQPNGLYDPIVRMIREQLGITGVPGFIDGPNNSRPEEVKDHSHILSALDTKLQYPMQIIRDDNDDIVEVWMADGGLKYSILKDTFEDIIGFNITILDEIVLQVRIIFTSYDPRTDPDTEDKGEIEFLLLLEDDPDLPIEIITEDGQGLSNI